MGSVEGVAKPDDHATGAVQRTTDPDVRISHVVVRSMSAVQRTTAPMHARRTPMDARRTPRHARRTL
jgi:hypothetical protein